MKDYSTSIAAAAVTVLLMKPLAVFAAGTYYPYQSYDKYYKEHSVTPPPSEEPAAPPPPPAEVKPPPRPEQTITVTEPPLFLFPQELAFGVAVGIPYDMFYARKEYFVIKNGNWYRSHSYRGPWVLAGPSAVPAEVRKEKLSRIHQLRNREFTRYFQDREHYKGKQFRPGEEQRLPMKREQRQPAPR